MALSGTVQYQFWDWCIRQSSSPNTEEQKKCVHNFGKHPLIQTTLGIEIWQCKHCKKLDVSSEAEE